MNVISAISITVLFLICGCICCPNPFEKDDEDYTTTYERTTYQQTTSTYQQTTSTYPQTTSTYPQTTSTQPSTTYVQTTFSAPTTLPLPNTSPNFLRDKMSIEIVGCENDYYRNAMVAGWLVNLDDETAYNIPLVAEIQSSGGTPVEDGVREFTVSNVPPMSKTKFSVVFEKTSTWKKCRVYIK